MGKKIIANLFNYARQEGIDNIVIASDADRVSFYCSCLGKARRDLSLPKKLEQEFLANLRQILAIAPGELMAKKYYKIKSWNGQLNFYLTVLPSGAGEKIIIDIINRPQPLWRLGQLGLQSVDLKEMKRISQLRSGLVIVSSPFRGGKSATFYSLLLSLNNPSWNIYLLSENYPYEISGVNHLAPTAANWEKLLSHDCEAIFADDLDGPENLTLALRAASTGRLIIGTLTADDSGAVLDKILKIKLPLRLKLDALKVIVNQRLENLKKSRRGTRSGERQAIGLFEILKLTPELKEKILAVEGEKGEKTALKIKSLIRKSGFRPLESDRRQKIKDGLL
jgi:type II secretory ATPase GspE/PulE/Tfp pilus assembly ATPase PilB-like protein